MRPSTISKPTKADRVTVDSGGGKFPGRLTLGKLCAEFDLDRGYLSRVLRRYKVEPLRDGPRDWYLVADAKAAVEMAKAEPQESGTESSYKTAVARERARKLKLENDTREREMISRAAVAAEIQRIAAGVAAVRVRAEQEWPRLFAGAGDSIPANAEVLRAMFDDLFVKFSELGRALALP